MSNRAAWEREPHGTTAAYRRHYRLGEKPCDACRKAEAMRRAKHPGRDVYNARRREQYAAARAAGMSSTDALTARDGRQP